MKTAGRHIDIDSEDSVIKPIGQLAQVVANTSPGDMLLFMIALDRANPRLPSDDLTYSKLIRDFPAWFNTNFDELSETYNAEAQALFDTLEDFAVELFFHIRLTKE